MSSRRRFNVSERLSHCERCKRRVDLYPKISRKISRKNAWNGCMQYRKSLKNSRSKLRRVMVIIMLLLPMMNLMIT